MCPLFFHSRRAGGFSPQAPGPFPPSPRTSSPSATRFFPNKARTPGGNDVPSGSHDRRGFALTEAVHCSTLHSRWAGVGFGKMIIHLRPDR
jgi:hypothetical protein